MIIFNYRWFTALEDMPTLFKASQIKLLLDHLSDQTNQSIDYYGLGQMSNMINGSITQKYLYDSLLRRLQKGEDALNLAPNKIDEIARFLGYDNFNSFINEIEAPLSPTLKSLEGSYYSYVRKNSENGILFQSPVKIEREGSTMTLTLKGPQRIFRGEIELQDGCIFCLMKAHNKSFYHIYNIGKAKNPTILQGIFSGITSGNIPIAGRCVLVKQDEEFGNLENRSLEIAEIEKTGGILNQKLARYFVKYNGNNLIAGKSVSFDLDDLY